MEMRVYIANLGKYTEGELVGGWFTPPIDFEEVKERIGLDGQYEEYAIHDYELPFEIGEYCSIDEINRLCEAVESITDDKIRENAGAIISYFGFCSIVDLAEKQDEIVFYHCDSLEDLAAEFVEEGLYGEIPDMLTNYIDYAAIARDLEIEGSYYIFSQGIFEYSG